MCEKNFEGKMLSPPPNNEDDINEESTIDNDIKTDVNDIIVEPPKKKKRSYRRRSKIKEKICKTCGQDILENERRDMFMYKDTYHQLQVKEYCKDHESVHNHHKCKPNWCGDCDYLINYQVEIDVDKMYK